MSIRWFGLSVALLFVGCGSGKAVNQSCTTSTAPGSGDCGGGLTCYVAGSCNGAGCAGVCRRLCVTTADCPSTCSCDHGQLYETALCSGGPEC